jgi:DNA invertase Pin-like site-specific DNA recombinase
MWMGGNVPLGYDASERTLVINPVEAETVRRIFALYRELGCVRRVKEEADRLWLHTKRATTAEGAERGGSRIRSQYRVIRRRFRERLMPDPAN